MHMSYAAVLNLRVGMRAILLYGKTGVRRKLRVGGLAHPCNKCGAAYRCKYLGDVRICW